MLFTALAKTVLGIVRPIKRTFDLGPYRLTVRTPAFQAVNPGSIPGRVTDFGAAKSCDPKRAISFARVREANSGVMFCKLAERASWPARMNPFGRVPRPKRAAESFESREISR